MKFEENKSLKNLSTFQVGGNAKYYFESLSLEDLKEALLFVKNENCKVFVLGKGSNCLFDDRGFDGAVIHNKIDYCEFNENSVNVGAGYSLSKLAFDSAKKDLSGFEFAAGIPASVGGAIYMNASANNQKISDPLYSVSYLTYDGEEICLKKEDIEFSYRYSSFHNKKVIITSAQFELKNNAKAKENLDSFLAFKIQSQPLKSKNAGCVFRNPENLSAGKLIDESGFRGYRYNGALVSEKHANFIVNEDNASSKDILFLIELIKKEIKSKFNISLEMEICYVPY